MTALSQPSATVPIRIRFARGVDALRQEWLRSLIMIAAVLVVGGLVLYPLGILFNIGLRTEDGALTLANYRSVLTEPGLVSALINSLIISAATTVLSLVIALPMAWAVARTAMPGRQLLRVAVLIAFAVPAALDNMDPAYEEAAQMAGASAWRASLGVTMPLVLPAVLSASVFVFL